MASTTNASHLLDDYLDSLEGFPAEVTEQLRLIAEKDREFEEVRRAMFKKRNLLLKGEEKKLEAVMQETLLRKAEKEGAKALQLIEEKIEMENRLAFLIEGHLKRLEGDLATKLNTTHPRPHRDMLAGLLSPELPASARLTRVSPKKRSTLEEEPIDPNEPVYCYCRQVSFGEMIACDGPNCHTEWFHYACVGLVAPPTGKWYCRDCSRQ